MANMHVYDIIILILVGWLTLRGAMKGMVSQLASIAAVIASFWAAVRFGPVLQPIMQTTFGAEPPWNKVLAITVAFVGASIAVMFLKSIVMKIIRAIHMNKFDRLSGAAFGFLKGVLIGMIITFFAVMLSEQSRDWVTQSRSGRILVRLIQNTQSLLPEDVSTLIETNLEGFRQQIDKTDGVISKVDDTSKTLSKAQNAFLLMQKTVTNIKDQFSGSSDTADAKPSLTNNLSARDYLPPVESLIPSTFTSQYPTTQEIESTNTTTPNPTSTIQFNTSPDYGPLTSQTSVTTPSYASSAVSANSTVSTSIVAPSAELQPMTSTTTPPLPARTDWRTLFREMK